MSSGSQLRIVLFVSGYPENPVAELRRAAAWLAEVADVVGGRVGEPQPPDWVQRRGWSGYLLGLDDEALRRAEQVGPQALFVDDAAAPESLRELAAEVRRVAVPAGPEPPAAARELKRAKQRKRDQIALLVTRCRALPGQRRRLVDVGAGLGHLTRELARELDLPALGLERDPARVAMAAELTTRAGETGGVTFEARELTNELQLSPDDLLVGLHACGVLGDLAVRSAASSGAGLLVVNCCLQKVPGELREPLSEAGRRGGLGLAREHLGLTNTLSRRELVEADPRRVMQARSKRHALRLLAEALTGERPPPGEEMRGLHRRHSRLPWPELAARACEVRDWPLPSPLELAELERRAEGEHARIRRLSLPRNMLGRYLERAIALDRACLLAEAGRELTLELVFPSRISPRNLALIAP